RVARAVGLGHVEQAVLRVGVEGVGVRVHRRRVVAGAAHQPDVIGQAHQRRLNVPDADGRVADGGVATDVGNVAAHHDLTGHLGVGRIQVVGRAFEELDAGAGGLEVRGVGVPGRPGRAVEVPVDVELAVECVLFEVGQQD